MRLPAVIPSSCLQRGEDAEERFETGQAESPPDQEGAARWPCISLQKPGVWHNSLLLAGQETWSFALDHKGKCSTADVLIERVGDRCETFPC